MSLLRCEFTDLFKNQCAHCLGHQLGDENDDQPIFFGGLIGLVPRSSDTALESRKAGNEGEGTSSDS